MKSKEYWKDYKVVEVLGPHGKVRRELQYFGDYYVYELEKAALKHRRTAMLLMACVADICFVIAATRMIGANSSGPVSSCGLISVIPLFFMTIGTIKNRCSGEKLTKNEFRETQEYSKTGAVVMTVLGAVNAMLRILYFAAFTDHTKTLEYMLSTTLFAFCAALSLGIYCTIKRMPVTVIPGPGTGD